MQIIKYVSLIIDQAFYLILSNTQTLKKYI